MTKTKKVVYIIEVDLVEDTNDPNTLNNGLNEFENLLTDFLENCDFQVSLNNNTKIVVDKV